MEFIDYLKYKEADVIANIGEKNWQDNKLFFVNQITELVNEYLSISPPYCLLSETQDSTSEPAMIDNVHIKSVLQKYDADDGRPDKLWTVGDNTTIGKIIEFKYAHAGENMYALTDTPSEWQAKNGMQHGWAWVFQLQPSQ